MGLFKNHPELAYTPVFDASTAAATLASIPGSAAARTEFLANSDPDAALTVAAPCPERDLIAQLPVSSSVGSAVVLVQGSLVALVDDLCEEMGALPLVTDEASRAAAHAVGVRANKLRSLVEAQRQLVKAPFLEAGRALDQAARGVLDPLDAIVAEVREQETTFLVERDRQLRAAEDERRRQETLALQAARDAAARAAPAPAQVTLPALVPVVQQDETAAKLVSRPEVVVVNQDLVPRQYWVLDMVKVRKDALAMHALGQAIPGVEVRQAKSVRMQ